MKLSQRIAIFPFCCPVGSATHSIFAQTDTEGLRGVVTDATRSVAAKADRSTIEAPRSVARTLGPSTLIAEPHAGFTPQQSLDSSTSQVQLWSIRHNLAQNIHSLRSSAGQDVAPEDQLQVLVRTTKK